MRWLLASLSVAAAGCGAHGRTVLVHAEMPRVTAFVIAVGDSSMTSRDVLLRELEEQARGAGCTRLFAVTYDDGPKHPMAAAACDDEPGGAPP